MRNNTIEAIKNIIGKNQKYGSWKMYKYYVEHPSEAKKKLQLLCPNCNKLKQYLNEEFGYKHR